MIDFNSQDYKGMKNILIAIIIIFILEFSVTLGVICKKSQKQNTVEYVTENGTDIWNN